MQPNPNYQRYDIKANAERIAQLDNPIERRQALEKVPRAYRDGVEGLVQMRFTARMRAARGR